METSEFQQVFSAISINLLSSQIRHEAMLNVIIEMLIDSKSKSDNSNPEDIRNEVNRVKAIMQNKISSDYIELIKLLELFKPSA